MLRFVCNICKKLTQSGIACLKQVNDTWFSYIYSICMYMRERERFKTALQVKFHFE